jgi:transposase
MMSNRRIKSKYDWKEDGGPLHSESKITRPPLEVIDSIRLFEPQTWRNKSFLHQKYVLEGLSIRQIAVLVFSSKESVRTELRKANIQLRDKSNHHGHPSQLKFGQRVVKGKAIEHKAEQRVVESVRQMKREGLSLRAIARCLDQMKIPTKNRGKKWHQEMVRRILDE